MPAPRIAFGQPRLWMCLSRRGVPDVPFFGRYNHTNARPGLAPHRHVGTLEICYLVKGRQTYRVGGRDYRLSGGDVFVAFPNEWHDTGGLPQEKGVLYWLALRVRPARPGAFLGRPGPRGAALRRALLALPSRHFRGSGRMKEHLDAITRAYHAPAAPLRAVTMAHHTEAFVLEVIAGAGAGPRRAGAGALDPVLAHVRGHLDEPGSVPALAALAGLSVGRFKARFKQEVGVPPGEYVLRMRVEEAARRLRRGRADITTVAYDLGFSSSQYFATVCKRFTGQTPSALRRS